MQSLAANEKLVRSFIFTVGAIVLVLGFMDLYSHAVPNSGLPHTHEHGETHAH